MFSYPHPSYFRQHLNTETICFLTRLKNVSGKPYFSVVTFVKIHLSWTALTRYPRIVKKEWNMPVSD